MTLRAIEKELEDMPFVTMFVQHDKAKVVLCSGIGAIARYLKAILAWITWVVIAFELIFMWQKNPYNSGYCLMFY